MSYCGACCKTGHTAAYCTRPAEARDRARVDRSNPQAFCGACSRSGHRTGDCLSYGGGGGGGGSSADTAAAPEPLPLTPTERDEIVAIDEATLNGVTFLPGDGAVGGGARDGDSFRLETTAGDFVVGADKLDAMLRANKNGNRYHVLATPGTAVQYRAIDADALAKLVAEASDDHGDCFGGGAAAAAAATPTNGDYRNHLGIMRDPEVSPELRAHVLEGMPLYHPALQHLHAFQRENTSLGRQWTSAEGTPKRNQTMGRWWFGRCGTPLGPDVHVDHVVPYSLGGAHTSANATLLTAKANVTKGASFSYETVLQAGSIAAGARAIHESAHVGNKHHGKYTGGVPAPKTFFYPKYALADNDGKSLQRNVEIMRDMARKQKEGVPTRVDGSPDQRYKYKAPLKADGTVDERYRTQSLYRNDVRTDSGGGGGAAAAAAATTTPSIRLRSDGGVSAASAAVRSGAVLLNKDGSVNRSCAAVRSGDVFFTKSGAIDGRCAAARAASSSSAKGGGGGGGKGGGGGGRSAGGSGSKGGGGGRSGGSGGKGGGGGRSGGGGGGKSGGGGRSGGGGKGGRK